MINIHAIYTYLFFWQRNRPNIYFQLNIIFIVNKENIFEYISINFLIIQYIHKYRRK